MFDMISPVHRAGGRGGAGNTRDRGRAPAGLGSFGLAEGGGCRRFRGILAHFLFRFGTPWWVESHEPERRDWDDANMAAVSSYG